MAGEFRGARKQPNAVLIGHHSLEGGSRRCGALAGAAGADERLPPSADPRTLCAERYMVSIVQRG